MISAAYIAPRLRGESSILTDMRFYEVLMGIAAIVCSVAIALLLHRTRAGRALKERVPDRPQRRILLANFSFVVTFAIVRAMANLARNDIGPFHYVEMGGLHIHHLVWGILLLLLVGYGWLLEIGNGESDSSAFMGRLMSLLYGAGAAMTLDEFALWLNLKDVYWARQGRESIEAGLVFLAVCTMGYIAARAENRGKSGRGLRG
ncbi:MAG: hypothetical protein ABI383_07355 [Acidobacteriaceae bacterium]